MICNEYNNRLLRKNTMNITYGQTFWSYIYIHVQISSLNKIQRFNVPAIAAATTSAIVYIYAMLCTIATDVEPVFDYKIENI